MEHNGGGLTRTLSGDSTAPPSPEETLSQWRRSAPKQKGNFRHAYIEKVWGPAGWTDVGMYLHLSTNLELITFLRARRLGLFNMW